MSIWAAHLLEHFSRHWPLRPSPHPQCHRIPSRALPWATRARPGHPGRRSFCLPLPPRCRVAPSSCRCSFSYSGSAARCVTPSWRACDIRCPSSSSPHISRLSRTWALPPSRAPLVVATASFFGSAVVSTPLAGPMGSQRRRPLPVVTLVVPPFPLQPCFPSPAPPFMAPLLAAQRN